MSKIPLYQQIINDIKKDIVCGRYTKGDKIATELELSEKYQVSRITSKRALVELEAEGLIYRVRGKGSFVKGIPSKVSTNKKEDLLFVSPFSHDTSFGNYAQGVFQALAGTSYRVVMLGHDQLSQYQIAEVVENYAGVLFYPMTQEIDIDWLYHLYLHRVPTVILDKEYEAIGFPSVVADNEQGGYEATKHMLASGLKKIAFVSSMPLLEVSTIQTRYLGYLKALYEENVTERCLYQNLERLALDDYLEEVVSQMLAQGVEGIVAENDIVAISLVNQLKERGIQIPEEVSIVGFDNSQASQLITPKLTTVAQDFAEMGALAAKRLIHQIEEASIQATQDVVPICLKVRETTHQEK